LHEGFNGVAGKVEAAPPKHLSSAIGQMVNFLGALQNEWAAAQAFSSFDTLDIKAPFTRYTFLAASPGGGPRARRSLEAVLASGISYELRTTALH
jgi:hypothetical protein